MNKTIYDLEYVRKERLGGIGRVSLYRLINEGHLKRVKIGRRSFITEESINAYLAKIEEEA
ncbi:helix-turn-helix domain-containing protein [Nocardia cyriacigeorgica]|uniref:helix-turn-helix domain-containing protein n=1 Tax=Nocardia cyriacigeorgica TaxID=135487 RepID=UPI002455DCC1|nr:helix-turn-helix domain-containing protein [Nocardia cyriacigeorgica]